MLGIAATPQVRIPGSNAIVDFLLDDAPVVIEFDGRVKYGRGADELDPFGRRRSGQEVLWQEKRREDRLRELGYEVVRVVWSELDSPAGAGGAAPARCGAVPSTDGVSRSGVNRSARL